MLIVYLGWMDGCLFAFWVAVPLVSGLHAKLREPCVFYDVQNHLFIEHPAKKQISILSKILNSSFNAVLKKMQIMSSLEGRKPPFKNLKQKQRFC